ncbi:beta-hexosaminidase 1-like isoform X1 [Physcomitrium patens]|uniref:beta-hexosaminidase 1-like isoform X1 n=1 Tax=Physcomitrium patens TaxID=3218 RepID=UPI003CCD01CC
MPVEVVLGDGKLSLERNTIIDVADNASVPDTLANAFARYYDVIFTHHTQQSRSSFPALTKLVVTLDSRDEEAPTIYGALRGHETFNQLTSFNFKSKSIHILKTHAINIPIPWTYKCIQMRLCFILSLHYNISCVVLDSFLASFHEAISIVDW